MSHGGAFRSPPPPRRRASPLSLHTLPPELLVSIASLLPLTSLSQLIRSSRHFFRELHGLTIRKPSFCPWRRRYESHRASFQAAYNAAEKRAYSRRIEGRIFDAAIAQPHQTQLEYETVVEGLLRDFGFMDHEKWGCGVDGDGDVGMGGTPSAPRTRFLMLDERMLLAALMGMWRQDDRVVLWLKKLNCDLQMLEDKLERVCPWGKVGMLAPEFVDGASQAMMVYVLLTVYLLYGGLQPADIPQLIEDCSPVVSSEAVVEDAEAALCEYFCFIGLFLDIWDAQVFMLETKPEDADRVQMDLWYHGNLRRRLNSKIQKWLDARFAPAKPLVPGSTTEKSPHRNGTLLPKERSVSGSFGRELMPHSAPTKRSGFEKSISWGLDKQLGSALNLGPHPRLAPLKDLLTEEQQRVVDTDLGPGQLMKIRAFAGTGKTRSLVEYAKRRPNKSFIYIAFNASAKLDAERKFGPNVECRTVHSAALKHLKTFSPVVSGANNANTMPLPSHWGAKDLIALFELDKHRTIIDALENPSNHLSPGERRRLGPLDPTTSTQKLPFPTATTVATTIKGALERFWASTAQKVDKYCLPTHMIEKVGLKPEAVLQWTKTVWHSIQEGTAPWLPHDAYLKLMQLNPVADAAAFERFDTIMFDEAQDASPCMASIILRQLQLGRSIIVVGDPYQKIYGFRGAGNDCFDDELYPPTRTCFLTHSFRFGDNIAGIANMLLRALKEPKQVHGVRRHDAVKLAPPTSVLNNPRMPPLPPQKEPFTIIFRKNITLISTAISFCLTHPLHKMYLRLARSITKRTLFANLRAAHALLRYGTQANTGPLADWKNWDTLKEHVSAASKAGDDTPQILVLLVGLEEHLASESFLAHLANLERNVLGDDESDAADVVFTTAHQAKGLEWDRVQVAPDFGPDFKKRGRLCGSKYWREECGLLYVAVTRARKELLVASPITWYAAAEEGVVDVSIAKEEVATCDVCGEQWDTCWGVLELKKATWEEGRFDVVIPTPTSSNTATTITTTPISPSSASTSSSSSSSSSTLSSPATLSPLSQPHLRPPQQPRTTIKACGRCSHVTNQFMCSLQPEAQGYRWRPMACWDAAWQAKYDAESARVQGGLRRRHEEGDWGDDDGGGDDDDGAGGAVVNGVVIGVGAGGGGGGAGLVMEEEEEVEGWWGEKVRV